MIGAVDLRLDLNDGLLHSGVHMGVGIRPSFRNQGHDKQMTGMALDACENLDYRMY